MSAGTTPRAAARAMRDACCARWTTNDKMMMTDAYYGKAEGAQRATLYVWRRPPEAERTRCRSHLDRVRAAATLPSDSTGRCPTTRLRLRLGAPASAGTQMSATL